MKITNKKILAIIPARGGSKGILKKNIFPIAGKPLLAWTIEAALGSKLINRVIVSSDSEEILQIASKYNAEPIRRPKRIAGDNSPFNLLIFHALKYLKKKENYMPDILVYLQPTSPIRGKHDIDKALSMMIENISGVISVYEEDNKFLKSFAINRDGYMVGIVNNKFPFINRQDLPKIYMPNGAIYAIKRRVFLKISRLVSNKTVPFVMDCKKSLDIDSMLDVKKAEKILKQKNHEKNDLNLVNRNYSL